SMPGCVTGADSASGKPHDGLKAYPYGLARGRPAPSTHGRRTRAMTTTGSVTRRSPRAFVTLTVLFAVAIPMLTFAQQQAVPPPDSPQPPDVLLSDPETGTACPLARVALIRGSDSEARDGGGFDASRGRGTIHGAVDLNGSLGEPILAVANGKVVVAARHAWGKLGKTVVIDHLDGGQTIYGHLHTVDVSVNSTVTAGQFIGTMGYSGNARKLQAKKLPPHLHFAYVRGLVPLTQVKHSDDGLGMPLASYNVLAGVTGVL